MGRFARSHNSAEGRTYMVLHTLAWQHYSQLYCGAKTRYCDRWLGMIASSNHMIDKIRSDAATVRQRCSIVDAPLCVSPSYTLLSLTLLTLSWQWFSRYPRLALCVCLARGVYGCTGVCVSCTYSSEIVHTLRFHPLCCLRCLVYRLELLFGVDLMIHARSIPLAGEDSKAADLLAIARSTRSAHQWLGQR
jgi:hypothetical protein